METILERSPRYVVSDHELRDELRQVLFNLLRKDPRYLAIVRQDLGPLWRQAARVNLWDRKRPLPFHEVYDRWSRLGETQVATEVREATSRYVQELLKTVQRTLRMTLDGYWVMWAASMVHDDASERNSERWKSPSLMPTRRDPTDDRFGLALVVSANSVRFRLAEWPPEGEDNVVAADELVLDRFGYDQSHWRSLKEETTKVVSWAVDEIRNRIESLHPAHNASSLLKRQQDLDGVYRWLFHRVEPADRANRERLRRIFKQIELDLPVSDGRDRPNLMGSNQRQTQDLHDRPPANHADG